MTPNDDTKGGPVAILPLLQLLLQAGGPPQNAPSASLHTQDINAAAQRGFMDADTGNQASGTGNPRTKSDLSNTFNILGNLFTSLGTAPAGTQADANNQRANQLNAQFHANKGLAQQQEQNSSFYGMLSELVKKYLAQE